MISWYLFVSQKIKLVGAFKYFSCSPLFGKDSQFDGAHIFQRGWFKTTNKTNTRPFSTIDYLRVLIIEIGSTIILMVVEAQGIASIFFIWLLVSGLPNSQRNVARLLRGRSTRNLRSWWMKRVASLSQFEGENVVEKNSYKWRYNWCKPL